MIGDLKASPSISPQASHVGWLPSAQANPEQRFWYESLVERGLVPDAMIRMAIRRMLRQRLRHEDRGGEAANRAKLLAFIEERARLSGIRNVRILTADMNSFDAGAFGNAVYFDRVVSIEMFEHMRNWKALLERIAGWLKPDGKLFVHIFTHSRFAYPFEVRNTGD
jgi:hypothetical protein